MNEEDLIALGQLAEEIADSEFADTESVEDIVDTPVRDTVEVTVGNTTVTLGYSLGDTSDPFEHRTSAADEADNTNAPEEEERDFIAPNISTSVIEETTTRFRGAEWFEKMQQQRIIIAGLGGIGSWCALLLGRCHPYEIFLFDGDTVELVNMAGQLYKSEDVRRAKTYVCADVLRDYSNFHNTVSFGRYDNDDTLTTDIMICGFDNMESRKFFYRQWKNHALRSTTPKNCLFIDGRLNAEEWQIFAIRGTDRYRMGQYEEKWLFDDSEVEDALCSYKQTSFCASMIASYMVNIFVNFVANLCEPLIDRDLPFLTEYDAKTMYLKTVQ